MKEITIVGGGLAGLSLGVYLRQRGVPVTLYEAGQYPKHKVCGEFICGVLEEYLREMGVENIVGDSVHHHQMSWTINEEKVLETSIPTVAWGLSRYKLDQDLAARFANQGGQLRLKSPYKERNMAHPGLVHAVGKNQKQGIKKERQKEWLGLKLHLTALPTDLKGLEMHLGSAGYLGICQVEENRVNCCGLFEVQKGLKGRQIELFFSYLEANGLATLSRRLAAQPHDPASFCATAGFKLGAQEPVGSFCIGDTANLIPPFTGNGMSMALESSYFAGRALVEYAAGQLNWEECCARYQKDCKNHFQRRLKRAKLLHPLLFRPWGRKTLRTLAKSGLLPVNVLFQQLRTP